MVYSLKTQMESHLATCLQSGPGLCLLGMSKVSCFCSSVTDWHLMTRTRSDDSNKPVLLPSKCKPTMYQNFFFLGGGRGGEGRGAGLEAGGA